MTQPQVSDYVKDFQELQLNLFGGKRYSVLESFLIAKVEEAREVGMTNGISEAGQILYSKRELEEAEARGRNEAVDYIRDAVLDAGPENGFMLTPAIIESARSKQV